MAKMHENELEIDENFANTLIETQCPQWSGLPIAPVISSGTDNALFRLGNEYIIRLPRIEWESGSVSKSINKEYEWLPKIAKFLKIPISEPIFKGHPDKSYPWSWLISKWNEGHNPEFENDNEYELLALEQTELAEKRGIDILCFPESYLHGYFANKEDAIKHAINLQSEAFSNLCKLFSKFNHTTVLLGLNELDNDGIYNTVVVIEKGQCIGKYRKAYTYSPYDYYSVGRDFPIFEKKGIKYGIVICLDSAYREPAHIAALKGARIIFCPSFNRIAKEARMLHYLHRKSHFVSRAFDNHCWFVVSDIIWDEVNEVCPGYSCILSDDGELVAKAEPFQENILTHSISLDALKIRKKTRIFGNPELFEIVKKTYEQNIK